jgi:hypothetical protein
VKVGVKTVVGKAVAKQAKMWSLEECPACNSKEISTNYFTGEIFCLKCGLVIY